MGMMDSIGGSIAQNTGNIEKAIIEILDLRDRSLIEKKSISIVGRQDAAGGAGAFAGKAGSSFSNLGVLHDAVKALAGFSDEETIDDEKLKSIASNNWKRYQVKFNPTTLQLSGHSGGSIQKSDYDNNGKGGNTLGRGDTTVTMSVQLLFDACDPQDAFMADKSNTSVTSMATGIGKAVLTGFNKKKISVQSDVEGFIGAIRNPNTRIITFHWGKISYSGVLRSVRTVYTMFNITGDPIRATMDLSITCVDSELSDASLSVWQERYKASFRKGSESFAYSNGTANSLIGKGKDIAGRGIGGMLGF